MLPDPLHPAVVHLPVALALLLPLVVVAAWIAIARSSRAETGRAPRRAWSFVVLAYALLAGSSWAAVQTGEATAESVEERLGEAQVEEHEEAGERFLLLASIGLGLAALGLAPAAAGRAGRGLGTAAAAVLLVAGLQTGHSGGQLVYGPGGLARGARASLAETSPAAPLAPRNGGGREDDGD